MFFHDLSVAFFVAIVFFLVFCFVIFVFVILSFRAFLFVLPCSTSFGWCCSLYLFHAGGVHCSSSKVCVVVLGFFSLGWVVLFPLSFLVVLLLLVFWGDVVVSSSFFSGAVFFSLLWVVLLSPILSCGWCCFPLLLLLRGVACLRLLLWVVLFR